MATELWYRCHKMVVLGMSASDLHDMGTICSLPRGIAHNHPADSAQPFLYSGSAYIPIFSSLLPVSFLNVFLALAA